METQKFEDKDNFWRHRNFRDTECFNVVNATLVYGCFNICTTIRIASHILGTTTLIQLWYNVGTTIPDLETRKFEDKVIFWRHGNFRDMECFNVANATLVYSCFNICTKYFLKLCKKYPFRTFRWIFTSLIFFLHQFFTGVFFYLNIILKLDFGYNIFVFEVIMLLFSNFFRYGSDGFFYTKYYLKNSFFVIIFLVTFEVLRRTIFMCVCVCDTSSITARLLQGVTSTSTSGGNINVYFWGGG